MRNILTVLMVVIFSMVVSGCYESHVDVCDQLAWLEGDHCPLWYDDPDLYPRLVEMTCGSLRRGEGEACHDEWQTFAECQAAMWEQTWCDVSETGLACSDLLEDYQRCTSPIGEVLTW